MIFELPYPPSVNGYWAPTRKGFWKSGLRLSKKGERYRGDVQAAMLEKRIKRFRGRLYLGILLCAPDHRKRDVDNVLKATLDALMHAGLYDDDAQIDRLLIERGVVMPPRGKLVVVIEDLGVARQQELLDARER